MTEQQIIARLSPANRDILTMIASGLADKEIGRRLGVSADTVKNHGKVIRATLRVKNRAEAAAVAAKAGLV